MAGSIAASSFACGTCVSIKKSPLAVSTASTICSCPQLPPPRSSFVPSQGQSVIGFQLGSLAFLSHRYGPGVELHTRVPFLPNISLLSRHNAARNPAFHFAMVAESQPAFDVQTR